MRKQIVSMVLKQDWRYFGKNNLTDAQQQSVYENFRARVEAKSKLKYLEKGVEPELLRLYILGSMFHSTVEYLVKVGSFQILTGSDDNKQEIGFSVELKSNLTRKLIRLIVWRKQFTASLEIGKPKKKKKK